MLNNLQWLINFNKLLSESTEEKKEKKRKSLAQVVDLLVKGREDRC